MTSIRDRIRGPGLVGPDCIRLLAGYVPELSVPYKLLFLFRLYGLIEIPRDCLGVKKWRQLWD